jgi:DNA-binding response OmpR family regulator
MRDTAPAKPSPVGVNCRVKPSYCERVLAIIDNRGKSASLRRGDKAVDSTFVVLLVEDDGNDAFFVKRALDRLGFSGRLEHVLSTEQAKRYFLGETPFGDREKFPLPKIIIADSSMSEGNGVEFREWINAEAVCQNVPFIILSGGVTPATKIRAEAAGIDLIFNKTSDFRETLCQLRKVLATDRATSQASEE